MERKKKLRIIQGGLIFVCFIIFFLTYFQDNSQIKNREAVSKNLKNKIEKNNIKEDTNTFYNIQYSGLDISGNRYIIKSKEATTLETNNALINMKDVEAYFYFKDNTVLTVFSEKAEYNNQTLDIKFFENINADYKNSKLFAQEAEYSNSKNFISITKNVKINDPEGNLYADKLLFDIKNQNLNITSFKNSKINANINLNEKRF
jgi:lipopolysaccharide assembly outer membrane protein LptD (OstA)